MFQEWHEHNQFPTLGDLVKRGYDIFDDSWDTHVKEHKRELCDKIIRYYWFNQIGAETPERFLWYLNEQLARIMPYYNQLYASELIKFNPLLNHSITSNGRSIENLLKSITSDNVKTNKVLRDFIHQNSSFGDSSGFVGVNRYENVDKSVDIVYNKDGTDDSITNSEQKLNETADTWSTINENKNKTSQETTKSILDGTDTGHSVTVLNSDKQITDKKDINIDVVVDSTDTDTGTVVDDGTGTSKSSGKKDWTEEREDNATTTVVTELNETTNSSGRKDYADTPQIKLDTGSGGSNATNGIPQVRADYLTNVTWNYDSSTHDLDSTVNTTFKDNESKTHTETTSDDKETTNKNTQTTDRTKKGDSTTTTTHTEDNSGTETLNSTSTTDSNNVKTENVNKNIDGIENIKSDTVQHSITTTDKTTNSNEVYDDNWTEKGGQTETTKAGKIGVEDTKSTTKSKETKSGRENLSEEGGSTSTGKESTERTTDTGTTDVTTGFMNIPVSALLESFRKTFLNIDQRIIDDLRENFLSVF